MQRYHLPNANLHWKNSQVINDAPWNYLSAFQVFTKTWITILHIYYEIWYRKRMFRITCMHEDEINPNKNRIIYWTSQLWETKKKLWRYDTAIKERVNSVIHISFNKLLRVSNWKKQLPCCHGWKLEMITMQAYWRMAQACHMKSVSSNQRKTIECYTLCT